MRYPSLVIALLIAVAARSQRVVDVGKDDVAVASVYFAVGGEPVSMVKYVRVVDGSPFYSEKWLTGSIRLSGGKRYDSMFLRLNLVDNEVHYLDPNASPLVATSPMSELWLNEEKGGKRHFVHVNYLTGLKDRGNIEGWIEVLHSGNVSLFKEYQKEIHESSSYGSGVKDQTIQTKSAYYVMIDGVLKPVKKPGDLETMLSSKSSEIASYIKANKLSGKKEGDYINVVAYYNSLVGQ